MALDVLSQICGYQVVGQEMTWRTCVLFCMYEQVASILAVLVHIEGGGVKEGGQLALLQRQAHNSGQVAPEHPSALNVCSVNYTGLWNSRI